MYRKDDLIKEIYKPKDLAPIFGVTTTTLRTWEKKGFIEFQRNDENRRYVTREYLIRLLKEKGLYEEADRSNRRDVLYARVSSHDQKKNGDLDRQIAFLVSSCDDLKSPLVLSEVGSGLNDKRKKLQTLIEMVLREEVNRVFITYRDRLTRFGYHYLESVFAAKGVEIIVVKQDVAEQSVEQELVDDMMALIASFSEKLYGLRSHSGKIKSLQKLTEDEKQLPEHLKPEDIME